VERPYSALTLRLVLAGFGVVSAAVMAVLLFRMGYGIAGWLAVALAVLALGNMVVVQLRRRARR
jgi:hypothetical protein